MNKKSQEVEQLVARLLSPFDRSAKKYSGDPELTGWGQFLDTADNQVGLYGTCSGLYVIESIRHLKVDSSIERLLLRYWSFYGTDKDRYFVQTPRLAFFVLCLTAGISLADRELNTVYHAAVAELMKRQRTDGSWSDATTISTPRIETTALATFALLRTRMPQTDRAVKAGGKYLHAVLLANLNQASPLDPFVTAVVLHALSVREVNTKLTKAALQRVLAEEPTNDTQIYYFDFRIWNDQEGKLQREFFCIPKFFGLCEIITAPPISKLRLGDWWVTLAFNKMADAIIALLKDAPVSTAPSGYKSTVDQAFLAMSANAIAGVEPRYSGLTMLISRYVNWIRGSWLLQVVVPLFFIFLLGAAAKDAKLIYALPEYFGWQVPRLRAQVDSANALIQTGSIFLGFIVSNPLFKRAMAFVKKKFALR